MLGAREVPNHFWEGALYFKWNVYNMEEDTVIQWNHCRSTWVPSISKQSCHLSSVHLNTCCRIPRALDQASVLPRTVVSLVQSSVLRTSRWGNYAQCAQSAVWRRPVETPPNPECCRQTIGVSGIAKACPGTMMTWLLFEQKRMNRKCAVGWDLATHSPLECFVPIP